MISFIQKSLGSKDVQSIFEAYLQKIDYPKKWIVLTDYCLDDPNKANVITFVLLHYNNEEEYKAQEQKILKLQKSDIKHTRYISNRLMRYLRRLPVFSFSFILNKRDVLFGDTPTSQRKAVIDNLFRKGLLSSVVENSIEHGYRKLLPKVNQGFGYRNKEGVKWKEV